MAISVNTVNRIFVGLGIHSCLQRTCMYICTEKVYNHVRRARRGERTCIAVQGQCLVYGAVLADFPYTRSQDGEEEVHPRFVTASVRRDYDEDDE